MKSISENESQYLYFLKGIACFFVVFIHYGLAYVGGFYELTRVAVPVFFIIQGRFLSVQHHEKTYIECREKNMRTLVKLLKNTMFVSGVYILLSFVLWVPSNQMNFVEWAYMKFAPIEWIKLLVFNSSKVIYDFILIFDHQWYLYATIIAVFIIILLQKILNRYVLVLLTMPLVMRLVNQYTFQIANDGIWIDGHYIEEMYLVRNFFFTGLPFLVYGMLLQYIEKDKLTKKKCNVIKLILITGCLCGIILTFMEYKYFGSQELYVGSTLIAICITAMGKFIDYNCKSVFTWIGKCLSKEIYFWHPLIATVLGCIFTINIDAKIYPFFVCGCSVCVAVFIWGVKELYERKKQLVS